MIPTEVYKIFKTKLKPPLLEMYQESFNIGSLPPSLDTATITLLLKPGKTPNQCGSYRPISLINHDLKILCIVLAMKLELILPKIVHADQNGFIQGKQGFHNIRRVLNILFEKSGLPPSCRWTLKRPLTGWSGCTYLMSCKGLALRGNFLVGFAFSTPTHMRKS